VRAGIRHANFETGVEYWNLDEITENVFFVAERVEKEVKESTRRRDPRARQGTEGQHRRKIDDANERMRDFGRGVKAGALEEKRQGDEERQRHGIGSQRLPIRERKERQDTDHAETERVNGREKRITSHQCLSGQGLPLPRAGDREGRPYGFIASEIAFNELSYRY
jgi:hypothetical protein